MLFENVKVRGLGGTRVGIKGFESDPIEAAFDPKLAQQQSPSSLSVTL